MRTFGRLCSSILGVDCFAQKRKTSTFGPAKTAKASLGRFSYFSNLCLRVERIPFSNLLLLQFRGKTVCTPYKRGLDSVVLRGRAEHRTVFGSLHLRPFSLLSLSRLLAPDLCRGLVCLRSVVLRPRVRQE